MMQFLDTTSKLKAARCSRRLLQAADHSFAWQGSSVWVGTRNRPRLGSLIRQSLLRHASIALSLDFVSDLPEAEVAAIPRLRELIIRYGHSSPAIIALLTSPLLQGLQTLRLFCPVPMSTLRPLPTLPICVNQCTHYSC